MSRQYKILYQSKLDVQAFAPDNLRFLEITRKRDYEIMHKLRKQNVLVKANRQGEWKIGYRREFDATGDSDKFITTENLLKELDGFIDSKILHTFGIIQDTRNSQIYLPVMEGKSIHIGKTKVEGYVNNEKELQSYNWTLPSRYFMKYEDAHGRIGNNTLKIAFRGVTSSTNTRSMIAAIAPNFPAIHTLPVIDQKTITQEILFIAIFLQSFAYDYYFRRVMTSTYVSQFIFKGTILPTPLDIKCKEKILSLAANLNLTLPVFCSFWQKHKSVFGVPIKYWALTDHEQLRLQVILHAVSAHFYSLSMDEYMYILRNDQNDVTGFFRIDRAKKEEHRLPNLCIKAYQELKEQGLFNFLESNWQLPNEIQNALGSRFLDWQIAMTDQEGFEQCDNYIFAYEKIFENQ